MMLRILIDCQQIAGNVAIQVISQKNKITIQIVNARTIGGDHL